MRENDIRPADLFAEYCRLSARDAKQMFDPATFRPSPCPGCGGTETTPAFVKEGFEYVSCAACDTLFVSPRPMEEDLNRFYGHSESSRYWAEVFMAAVLETRREKIVIPRVERVAQRATELGLTVGELLDIGAGHGMFLEEWRNRFPDTKLGAVEPGEALAACLRDKGFDVLETSAEGALTHSDTWNRKGDVVTCFEVIEHVHEPLGFARALHELTAPGGAALITGLGRDGFDIRVLGELSRSVSPPHHINFLSVEGFKSLFRRAGFSDVIVETPGKLDVDIVRRALYDPEYGEAVANRMGSFERAIVDGNDEQRDRFQSFLAENTLSSHVWVWARKS